MFYTIILLDKFVGEINHKYPDIRTIRIIVVAYAARS